MRGSRKAPPFCVCGQPGLWPAIPAGRPRLPQAGGLRQAEGLLASGLAMPYSCPVVRPQDRQAIGGRHEACTLLDRRYRSGTGGGTGHSGQSAGYRIHQRPDLGRGGKSHRHARTLRQPARAFPAAARGQIRRRQLGRRAGRAGHALHGQGRRGPSGAGTAAARGTGHRGSPSGQPFAEPAAAGRQGRGTGGAGLRDRGCREQARRRRAPAAGAGPPDPEQGQPACGEGRRALRPARHQPFRGEPAQRPGCRPALRFHL